MEKEQKSELTKIIVSIVILVALIVLEHTGVFPESFTGSRLFMIPFLIPILLCGSEVIKEAVEGIVHLEVMGEEFLMTVAVLGAFFIGEYSEGAAVMVFYSLGEWFQDYAVDKSRDSISELLDIAPEHANIIGEDGSVAEADPKQVKPGDMLLVKPGERVPVDGVIVKGSTMLDTAAITGESVPRSAGEGDQIVSGCINGESAVTVKAVSSYDNSTVARIMELVETASEKKSRTENFITRFAKIYTPAVVLSAVLLAAVPPLLGYGSFMNWIARACTFLVVSCPCALVISVPLSFFGGIGASSRIGALVKGSNYLEVLAETDTLVSDKTGTLTKGDFRVSRVIPEGSSEEAYILERAAYAEHFSTHPIASSIRAGYVECIEKDNGRLPVDASKISEHNNISGKGTSCMIDGKRIAVGKKSLMRELGIEADEVTGEAGTVVYVAEDDICLGAIVISDSIKETAREALADMRRTGIGRIVMLTGDRKETADIVAEELGVDEVYSELLPQDKVEIMEKVSSESRHAAFVGDGINDAPVLAGADLGIAMGSMGSDAAIEAADIVIMDDEIGKIPRVKRIAMKTVGIAKQNITFALAVKFLILVLGALGFANMWAAVFSDVGVAMLCVMNSMRMLGYRGE